MSDIMQLYHHGILNQKWGVRNGPPYPLQGGSYSIAEKKAIYKQRNNKNSIYNKKHFDTVLNEDTQLQTLSYDKERTTNTDMFYATHTDLDKAQYIASFNRKIDTTLYDSDGNIIGTGKSYKFVINNKLSKSIKVASEDSATNIFLDLYKKDRDFYNFITDENRMQNYFTDSKYKFKGYRESKNVLEKIRKGSSMTQSDVSKLYRMFNYILPYDGSESEDARGAKDVLTNRAKFFTACEKAGYSAVLDTNDAIYGGFKAGDPVIVFDMDSVILSTIEDTKMSDKAISNALLTLRKSGILTDR